MPIATISDRILFVNMLNSSMFIYVIARACCVFIKTFTLYNTQKRLFCSLKNYFFCKKMILPPYFSHLLVLSLLISHKFLYFRFLNSSANSPSFVHIKSIVTPSKRWTCDGVTMEYLRRKSELRTELLYFFSSFLRASRRSSACFIISLFSFVSGRLCDLSRNFL